MKKQLWWTNLNYDLAMEWNAIPAVVDLYLQGEQVNAMDPGQGQFDAKVLWLNEKDQVFEAHPKPVKGNYVTTCNPESHKMISEYEKKLEKQTKDSHHLSALIRLVREK